MVHNTSQATQALLTILWDDFCVQISESPSLPKAVARESWDGMVRNVRLHSTPPTET